MAKLTNLHHVSEGIPTISNFHKPCRNQTPTIKCLAHNSTEPQQLTIPRRVALSLTSLTLIMQPEIEPSLAAEDNGYWREIPLPVPPVYNNIHNEETGTRSFLKKGTYIANIGASGSAYRLKKTAFDLMAMEDLIGPDAWPYVRRYLCFKSTFMYYDFDKVISAAQVNDKQPLTDMANRLFNNFEKLLDAVKMHDLPMTESCYKDTKVVLQEVMDRMA